MKYFRVLLRMLACCRRIVLLLALLLTLLFAWFWWSVPDLNQIRPEIQAELQQRLDLQSLHLGSLSWRWRGDMEIVATDVALIGSHGQLHVRDAQLSLTVSLIALLRGSQRPEHIDIRDGSMRWQPNAVSDVTSEPSNTLTTNSMPLSLSFQHMMLEVYWKNQHYMLHHARGDFSIAQRSMKVTADELSMLAILDADGELQNLRLKLNDLRWASRIQAIQWSKPVALTLSLRRQSAQQWLLSSELLSHGAALDIPALPFHLPLDALTFQATIHSPSLFQYTQWQQVLFSHLAWQAGNNHITATAAWKKGVLSLHAKSSHLAMPVLWRWLQGIDQRPAWRAWLLRMQHGVAYDTQADITLPWAKPWQALVPSLAKNVFLYHVKGSVRDADIDLGKPGESLQHAQVQVELDQTGLDADIQAATLPHNMGQARGHLHIPWDHLMLHIKAQADAVDMPRLHRWVDPSGAAQWGWKQGSARGAVHLLWNPLKKTPDEASATLIPVEPWQLYVQDQYATVSSGRVEWDINHGVVAHDLAVAGDLFQSTLNFDAYAKGKSWALRKFNGEFSTQLPYLIHAFHIPLSKPSGVFRARLELAHDWLGTIILDDAAWDNFLGESKRIGQPMKIKFTAHVPTTGDIQVNRLLCYNPNYTVQGQGAWTKKQLEINLNTIKTRGFRGAVNIIIPHGSAPWQMRVKADYLRRSALPESVTTKATGRVDKHWQLRANIAHFDWKDARMKDVALSMRSERATPARFSASSIDSGNLHVQEVDVHFNLPGGGRVQVEQLNGVMNEQRLQMAATLTPESDGAMRWQGFAATQGDFSSMMQSGGMETVFAGGKAQMLLAGEGLLMRDQPWWQGLRGRLRLRVDEGSIAKGGLLTKLLAITSLADIPALLIGQRKDLTHAGLFYERLQIEATLADQVVDIRQLAMRSTAMDMAGKGSYDLEKAKIDLTMVFRPLQNLDAMLSKIPLLRDIIGGAAHSLIRKVYHMHGSISKAEIDQVSPSSAGLASPGLIEGLLTLPDRWFGSMKEKK
ncbi:MAG: AsmA-like C-terminal domain-containing protein [Mariprofundaceae bacterium]|nr:AsmA-like C-terminal domain-containing protein [Mariprofundaceae bacterium]